jgi:hypothetical protein
MLPWRSWPGCDIQFPEEAEMMSKAAVKWLVIGLAPLVHTGCGNDALNGQQGVGAVSALASQNEAIEAECVVKFFSSSNEGEYISTQRHRLYPSSKSIDIMAREPEGKLSWLLSDNSYESSVPPSAIDSLPGSIIDRDIVRAVAACFMASAGYYDLSSARQLEKVRINGRWYQPYQPDERASQLILFMLPDEGRVDLVRVASTSGDRVVTAHSYNKHWLKEAGRYVPAKIDVFVSAPSASEPQRVLGINYTSFNMLRKD